MKNEPRKEVFTKMKRTKLHIQNKRNIGIIAHVDAGKTTVSERILYYTGKIHQTVEVHNGGATMDHGKSEMKHGITISSAATTVHWGEHEINLIDTPGHVDFGIEVKRSLRVLDGAVVVFDAVGGVEPQTETNWRLANEFGVRRIAFINKMDRPGADFEGVVDMMRERLGTVPLPIQKPVTDPESGDLLGVIDLVNERYIRWLDKEGKKITTVAIPDSLLSETNEARTRLIELAIENDEYLMDNYLENGTDPTAVDLIRCLRIGTLEGLFVPILCGTALKNRGVQPLLDAVVDFLPSPEDCALPEGVAGDDLVAYAFKTTHRGSFGSQTWLRIYSGTMTSGSRLQNTTQDETERISRLMRMNSGKAEEILEASAGDIVAAIGLKKTRTGDTLCSAFDSDLVLETLVVPEPVTQVVIESGDRDDREKLGIGLNRLIAEDPTLQLSFDDETGQSVLAGMGELHLEMAKEKLEDELDIGVSFGRPQVAYRETISQSVELTYRHQKQDGGQGQFAEVLIRFEPLPRGKGFEFESRIVGGAISKEYIPGVEKGIRRAMQCGTINACPVVDIRAVLLDGKIHDNDSSVMAFEAAGFYSFREAMPQGSPVMLEPVMEVNVTTPAESLGDVISDLNRRRGLIESQESFINVNEIVAHVPLANLFGYIGDLRSLTSGRANFTMEFDHYAVKRA